MKQTERRGFVGIRWQLFGTLALLTVAFILVLWIFHAQILTYFYEREKFADIQKIATELSEQVNAETFSAQVESYAQENDACIIVFLIEQQGEGKIGVKVADAKAAVDCTVHHLPSEQLSRLYDSAKKNGGVYDKLMSVKRASNEDDQNFHVPGFQRGSNTKNAVHVRLLEQDGKEYLMVLDMPVTPVKAVTDALEMQFLWIVALMLIAAFFLAALASHVIARPLTDITDKARKLAAGNYEPNFEANTGYREIRELAEVLNHAATEIGATDRLQKELIANISHDLRTPLTMIKGYSEMMRDIPGENSPENVQAIIDETTRLSELVNDLMDLSKLQAGTQKITPDVFDLTETVRSTMQRYETLIRHQGYHIEFVPADRAAMVKADRVMLLQAIYNLINNAINYTGESKRVVVTETVADGKVRLSVADDGEGIPPEQIHEIWDRYYRVDKVHKRSVMGTGLGLSIVKGVLEAHNATYGVDSAVGVGSVFWFELALCDLPALSAPEEK